MIRRCNTRGSRAARRSRHPRPRELRADHPERPADPAPDDRPNLKLVPLDEAALRAVLRLRATDAKGAIRRKQEMAPILAQRRRAAVPFARQLIREVRANPSSNPFNHKVADLSRREAATQARLAARYLTTLYESGRVVNGEGKLTSHGRGRLTRAVQYLLALRKWAGEK